MFQLELDLEGARSPGPASHPKSSFLNSFPFQGPQGGAGTVGVQGVRSGCCLVPCPRARLVPQMYPNRVGAAPASPFLSPLP